MLGARYKIQWPWPCRRVHSVGAKLEVIHNM